MPIVEGCWDVGGFVSFFAKRFLTSEPRDYFQENHK